MEELMTLIVQNGVGVGSFLALLYFVNVYITKMNDTIHEIALTLTTIKDSLLTLSTRVDEIEDKIKRGE